MGVWVKERVVCVYGLQCYVIDLFKKLPSFSYPTVYIG